jgi:hypothetical protein
MTNEAGTPDPGTPDAAARSIPAEVLAETKGARTVVAPTDDGSDGAYRQGRAVAIALCAALNARLVLVDRATESWWIDPYGSGPVTADTDDLYSHGERPPGRAEPEALGRHYLVEQLDEQPASVSRSRSGWAVTPGSAPCVKRWNAPRSMWCSRSTGSSIRTGPSSPSCGATSSIGSGEAAAVRTVVVLSADGTLRAYPFAS